MAKVKIMKKELVWDVFCFTDDSKIGTTKSVYRFEEKLLEKMYSIVSVYNNYTYKQFIDHFCSFSALVGTDYYSLEELKNNWTEFGIFLYGIS